MELQVQKREIFGKKAESLREDGLIPAELYGHGIENIHLNVPVKEFSKVFKQAGESTVVNLKVESEKGKAGDEVNVLIHDIQKNPLTDEISHIDFYAVRMDEKITVSVQLEFIGEAPAVKEKGGVLIKAVQEIEVEALPADLPHSIKVDLSKLFDIGTSIHVRDLKIGEKVKVLIEPGTVVATVAEPTKEVVEKPITVEEVKVEGEEKAEEKEEEKKEE